MGRHQASRALAAALLVAGTLVTTASPVAAAPPPPRISVSSPSVLEGNSGIRVVKFLVSLSYPAPGTVTAQYTTADGSATGGAKAATPDADYVSTGTKTLTFTKGQVAKVVTVKVVPDAVIEGDETFSLSLSNVSGATATDGTGTATVVDDEAVTGFALGIGNQTVREGDVHSRSVPLVVAFSSAAPAPFTLTATTEAGSAQGVATVSKVPTGDYVTTTKSIAVNAGARFVAVTVPLLPDGMTEGDETFDVTVSSSLGNVVGGPATVTITDDEADNLAWIRQLASGAAGTAHRSAVDSAGNTFVVGGTDVTLPGSPVPAAGGLDVFVAKYSPAGALLWVRQLGSSSDEAVAEVTVDAADRVIVAGTTTGTLPGSPEAFAGAIDTFIAVYSPNGTLQWVHQVGAAVADRVDGLTVDGAGGPVLAATLQPTVYTTDPVVAHYAADGTLTSLDHQGATSADLFYATALAGTSGIHSHRFDPFGNAIAAGYVLTPGSPAYADAAVTKYDTNGVPQWTTALALGSDTILTDIAVDSSGNTIAAGRNHVGNGYAGFVALLDPNGTRQWVRYLQATPIPGTTITDAGMIGPALDSAGNIIVAGYTRGSMVDAVEPHRGGRTADMYAAKIAPDGSLMWIHVLGSIKNDVVLGMAVGPSDEVALGGWTAGTIVGSPTLGSGDDTFVVKLST